MARYPAPPHEVRCPQYGPQLPPPPGGGSKAHPPLGVGARTRDSTRSVLGASLVRELELHEELSATGAALDGHALVGEFHDGPVLDAAARLEG